MYCSQFSPLPKCLGMGPDGLRPHHLIDLVGPSVGNGSLLLVHALT